MLGERALWLLCACILAFFYRPLFVETFFFRDLTLLFYGKKLLFAEALRSGQIPLWDPLMHGGQPFLAEPNNAAFYPTNILFLILPVLAAFNINIVLQFLLCGVSAYFLARTLGLSTTSAFVTGCVYTFCGYVLSSANLMNLMQAMPWPPALLASVHLLLVERRKRWLVTGAISGALPLLAGAAELSAMSFALAAAWILFVGSEVADRRSRLAGLLAIAFASGLSLMQTLPAYEMIRNSSRHEKRDYATFVQWSVSPQRLPELVVPQFFGPTDTLARRDYWGGRYESGYPYIISIYFGTAALLLALAGAFASDAIPRRGRILLAVFAAVGSILSLGLYLPFFHFVWAHVPLLSMFRFPVKALQLALVPIALLAGAGIEAATKRRFVLPAAIVTLIFLITAIAFRGAVARAFFVDELPPESAAELTRSLMHAAIASALFVVALLTKQQRAIAALVLIDLAVAGWRVNSYASSELFVAPPLAAKVRAILGDGGRLYRTADPFVQTLNVPTNDNVWLAWWDIQLLSRYTAATWGIPLVFHEDYDGLAPIQMSRMTDAIAKLPWNERLKVLSAAGATAIITPDLIDSPDVELIDKVRGANGLPLYVYRNKTSRPLRFNPATPQPGNPATVKTLGRTMNQWSVEVFTPTPGRLTFNDTWYPGWKMTVDGAERPQLRADFGLSAVDVPAGRHIVTKRYRPRLPLIGLIGSIATALALAFFRLNQ